MSERIQVKYHGKRTTFRRNKVAGTNRYVYRVGGKLATKHQLRIARSLFKQQAQGLKPTVQAARGHVGERGTDEQARKAFYARYDHALMTQADIDANLHLQQGTFTINGKVYHQSWGSPWKTASLRGQYDWWAIVRCIPYVDADGKIVSPDGIPLDEEGDPDYTAMQQAAEPRDVVVGIYPEHADIGSHGYLMRDVIDGFEQNMAAAMLRYRYTPVDRESGEPVEPEEADRYVIGLFRHRYTPKDRRERVRSRL